ncbi:hypothetical protein IFM51744_09807 [Aspergillus udagawae]|nr:hypothetical protein IFM51744_09807 [Aspergillus udagawae]
MLVLPVQLVQMVFVFVHTLDCLPAMDNAVQVLVLRAAMGPALTYKITRAVVDPVAQYVQQVAAAVAGLALTLLPPLTADHAAMLVRQVRAAAMGSALMRLPTPQIVEHVVLLVQQVKVAAPGLAQT